MSLDSIKLKPRLIGAFLTVALILVVVATVGYINMGKMAAADTQLYRDNTVVLGHLGAVDTDLQHIRAEIYRYVYVPKSRAADKQVFQEMNAGITQHLEQYRANPLTADEKENLARFDASLAEFNTQREAVMAAADANDAKSVRAALAAGSPLITSRSVAVTAISKLVEINTAEAKQLSEENAALFRSSSIIAIIATIFGAVMAIALGLIIAKSITTPVNKLAAVAGKLAFGDVDVTVEASGKDEIADLMRAMGSMVENTKSQAAVAKQIAAGDLNVDISVKSDKDVLAHSMTSVVEALRRLVADVGALSQAAIEGRLLTRADASKHEGGYGEIVQGVNQTMDIVVGFLDALPTPVMSVDTEFNVLYMNKVGAEVGNRTPQKVLGSKCYDHFKTSDCRTEKCACASAMKSGLSASSETDAHPGTLNLEIAYSAIPLKSREGKVIGALELVTDQTAVRQAARASDKVAAFASTEASKVSGVLAAIAEGNLDAGVEVATGDSDTSSIRDSFVQIAASTDMARAAVSALVTDAGELSKAAVEGKLATRADAAKHQGDYRKIVQGVNDTLDAVVGPLNVAAEYVDRIGKGDIPDKITDNYNGDFNTIKNNLNACIDGLAGLTEANGVLQRMALNDYSTTVDGDYAGVFGEVAAAVNAVRSRVEHVRETVIKISLGNLEDLPTYKQIGNGSGRRCEHDELAPAMIRMMESVGALVTDANKLAQAGVAGELSTRADASKHSGDYRRIIDGFNDTLDAVIGPINEASKVLEQVANRDLTARVNGSYNGDLDRIKQAINTAVDNLDEGLQQVAIGSQQVASASVEISTGSQALSQSTSEQAASLEEISSSLQEMSSMTRQNASNAQEATGLAERARASSDQGVAKMERLSQAVDKIKSSSDQTAKIVKTIDEIAFQTNLLALNAAVEAARAGDAGKGFAVVAEEVRNLAMRSAEAAKTTANMIEESVKNAEGGVSINQEVLVNLREINQQVNKVSEVMNEIALSSEQQNQGIEQVATAVGEMDHLTQQNAANSEESASAAEELSSQAEEMLSMVAGFQLTGSTSTSGVKAVRDRRSRDRSVSEGGSRGAGARAHAPGIDPATAIPFDDDADVAALSSF